MVWTRLWLDVHLFLKLVHIPLVEVSGSFSDVLGQPWRHRSRGICGCINSRGLGCLLRATAWSSREGCSVHNRVTLSNGFDRLYSGLLRIVSLVAFVVLEKIGIPDAVHGLQTEDCSRRTELGILLFVSVRAAVFWVQRNAVHLLQTENLERWKRKVLTSYVK